MKNDLIGLSEFE